MPWGSSLGFAEFSRWEGTTLNPSPMDKPANSLCFLPPSDLNV